eukprot:SAG11_NODE_32730_length_281_cov_0.851648_2_plen_73_part_01
MSDSKWHRPGSGGGGSASLPQPNATFRALELGAGESVVLRVALAVGANHTDVTAASQSFAADASTFASAWSDA